MVNSSIYNKLILAVTVAVFFLFIFAYYFYLGPLEDFRYAKPISSVESFLLGSEELAQPEHVSYAYILTKRRAVYFSMLFFIFICVVAILLNVYGAKKQGPPRLCYFTKYNPPGV